MTQKSLPKGSFRPLASSHSALLFVFSVITNTPSDVKVVRGDGKT
jgi:hypothetical protein